MELIDKEALVQDLLDKSFYPAIVRRAIEQQPVIDAVDIRHASWVEKSYIHEYADESSEIRKYVVCEECGTQPPVGFGTVNYCCSCGAKMDGRRESEGT